MRMRCDVGVVGLALLLSALVSASVPQAARAQTTTEAPEPVSRPTISSQEAFTLAGDLMSPYCPGRTIAACPSSDAAVLRQEMAAKLAAGESRDVIVEGLVARFGENVRGAPRPVGIGLTLWVLPAVIGILILLAVVAAGWGRAGGAPGELDTAVSAAPGSPSLQRRLDDELDQMD